MAIKPRILEWLVSLRELQSQTGEELDELLPSVLDRAFKGELCPPPVLPPSGGREMSYLDENNYSVWLACL
jgi:hypothetical protein